MGLVFYPVGNCAVKRIVVALFFASFFLPTAFSSVIHITATVNNVAPTVSDGNISPSNWAGEGSVLLGFQCADPNGIGDFNRANATITGANAADLNNISYTVSGSVAIISENIAAYLATMGAYYVTPFCIDDINNATAGSTLTGAYVNVLTITITAPPPDVNVGSNPTISFDINKNTSEDVNGESISVDLNGVASGDFNYSAHCAEFSGHFHCSYTETGLSADADTNLSIDANNDSEQGGAQQSVLIHFDATAPTIASVSATGSGSDVAVTWSGSDAFTGIETYYVRQDSADWIDAGFVTTYAFSGSASASHTYYVKARDYADNNSLISSAAYTYTPVIPPVTPPGGGTGGGPGGGGGPSVPPVIPPVEGIFDINLLRVDDPVEAGEKVDFTFVVKNNSNANGNAYITYLLEKNGEMLVSGSETIYLLSGQSIERNESLLSAEEMSGVYEFYISLERSGQKKITLKKNISIMVGAPTKVELQLSSLDPGEEVKPLTFAMDISSNIDATLPVLVEERLLRDETLVWEKKQTVVVTVTRRFFEEVYDLPPGKYRLEVTVTYQNQVRKEAIEFEKKLEAEFAPFGGWLSVEGLLIFFNIIPILIALLLLAETLLLYRLRLAAGLPTGKKKRRRLRLARLTMVAIALTIAFLLFLYLQKDAIIASKFGPSTRLQELQLLETASTPGTAAGAAAQTLPGLPAYLIALAAIAGAALALFLTFRRKRESW